MNAVGQPISRVDGRLKVTGAAQYTADIPVKGAAHAAIVHSTIANGGTRGDFVGVDNNNGTLFLTQTDAVYRLSCGPGCGFAPAAPEPGASALTLIGIGWLMRKRILSRVRFGFGKRD